MTNKVVIVTGAAAGIGSAIVQRYIDSGHIVYGVDITDIYDCSHENYTHIRADISQSQSVDALIAQILEHHNHIDILVNNAGIGGAKAVHDTSDEIWERIIDVNLTAAFRMSRSVLPQMMIQKSGCIIHIASMFGTVGYRNTSAYAASKAGLVGLTTQMTADYSANGIRVNAVAPGLIRTAMTEKLLLDPVYRELVLEATPAARMGEVEDVAALVEFISSDQAGFICGQVIGVDGGWTAARTRNFTGS